MSKIREEHDLDEYEKASLLQLSVDDHEMVYNLKDSNFFEVQLLDDDNVFRDPIKFSMTGFECRKPYKSMMVNYNRSLGFQTPCFKKGRAGLVRSFTEIDLKQILELAKTI